MGDSTRWLQKARLWRFILLAHTHGGENAEDEASRESGDVTAYWDSTPGLALALQASFAPVPAIAPLARGDDEYEKRAGVCLALRSLLDDEATSARRSTQLVAGAAEAAAARTGEEGEHEGVDCPLLFQHAAIDASLPRWLRDVCAAETTSADVAAADHDDVACASPLRCWTTALVAASLRTLSFGWLVSLGEGDAGGGAQRTLADAADAWLAAQPRLAPRLRDLTAAAAAQVAAWGASQHARVAAMRLEEMRLEGRRATLTVRSSGEVMTAIMTKHETFAVFLAPGIDLFAPAAGHDPRHVRGGAADRAPVAARVASRRPARRHFSRQLFAFSRTKKPKSDPHTPSPLPARSVATVCVRIPRRCGQRCAAAARAPARGARAPQRWCAAWGSCHNCAPLR
jgi:hypothetical protein